MKSLVRHFVFKRLELEFVYVNVETVDMYVPRSIFSSCGFICNTVSSFDYVTEHNF